MTVAINNDENDGHLWKISNEFSKIGPVWMTLYFGIWKLKNQEHLKVQSGTLARYALKNGLFSSSLVFNCNKLCIFFSELNI